MPTALRVTVAAFALVDAAAFGQTADAPIKTTLCDIVKDPERFNGKIVQIRATAMTGFEERLLIDDTCSARIWFEDSMPVRRDKQHERMETYLRNPPHAVIVMVTGRFDHVGWFTRITGHGFGHLNGWNSQFVLQSVRDVEAKPIDPPHEQRH
jgi:hypothetical protein